TAANLLLGGANTISTLNSLSATGTISLQDTAALNVNGNVAAVVITLAAAGLDLASQISATGLALLDSSGSLSQSGGGLNAGTLSGSIANDASLGGTLNSIATLAGFTAGGTLNLTDQTALTQTGSVAGANVTLAAAGLALNGNVSATSSLNLTSTGSLSQGSTLSGNSISLSGTSLALDGTVDATALNLDASAGISQAGTGVLSVASLTGIGTPSGAILLGGTANAIGTLEALAAGQNILIANASTAVIAGQVSAGTALTLQGAGFTESGAGAIDATLLTGSLSGGLALGGSNAIGTLGALAASGNVQLADTSALAIAGLVSTTGTLSLTGTGAVNEIAGGTLDISALTGSIGGALSLANANSIGSLGALSASGNIVLDNTGTITLGGAVSAGTSLALATNGLLEGP
ncbi:MAG: hypothetical protein KGK02_11490, partial [Rhodospirillales bacterium]|nr:hypothetical protein [Rhodospirillales bacterium]